MSQFKIVFFIALSLHLFIKSGQSQRPKGVPLSRGVLYDEKSDFTCLDGLNTIPFSYVNDDYCDCQDASDEPGTSACPNGNFYCINSGYKPLIIPSSRVNDGICDCCDTSDEWQNASACENTCNEFNKIAQAELLKKAEEANKGFDIRQQYSATGMQVKSENQAKLVRLKAEVDEARNKVMGLQLKKDSAESEEKAAKAEEQMRWDEFKAMVAAREDLQDAIAAFVSLDVDRDAIVTLAEILPHKELDPEEANDFSEEDARKLIGGDSVEAKIFLEVTWQFISNKFVYLETTPPPPIVEEIPQPPQIEELGEEEEEEEDDYDEPYDDEFEEGDEKYDEDEQGEEEEEGYWDEAGKHMVPVHEPAKEAEPATGEEKPQEELLIVEEGKAEQKEVKRSVDLPNDPPYNPVTRILIQAADDLRSQHTAALNEQKRMERDISEIEKTLEMDFGLDEAFYTLKGQCFELKTLEYIYKLCPFDKSVQIPINGGSDTSLGKWEGWSGPDDNKHSAMKYTRGLKCWNGPDRSTEVILSCGSENSVISASEPSRCEYRFEFTTPAVCKRIFVPESHHDEL